MRIKTFLGNLKIREKFFGITGLIVLVVCIASLAAFHVFAGIYEHRIYTEAAEVLNLSSSAIDSELSEIEKWSFQMSTDARIQDYLAFIRGNDTIYELFRVRENLFNRMLYFMEQEKYISSLQIMDSQGTVLTTVTFGIQDQGLDLERIAKEAGGSNVWLAGREDSQKLISIRQIRGMENLNLSHYGVLVFWIDMETLVDQFLDLSADKLFVIAQNDQIVFSNNPELDETEFINSQGKNGFEIREIHGKKYLISYLTSEHHDGLSYYNILPYEVISRQTGQLRTQMILFFIVLFLLVLPISRMAAHSITKPLVSLTEKIKQVQRGNFENTDTLQSTPNMDEIGQLHRNFRIMLEKINELFKENYQKQLIIQETEYKALQAQINPHFLYNTLDTINWMAKINKQHQIAETVEALGNMLRSVISKKEPLIPILEELNILNDYVTIQKNRFDDRLDFRLNVDQEINLCFIPKLTLQPVVENAIQHGLEAVRGVCRIEVVAERVGEHIEIVVSDNGPGMDAQKLEDLRMGKVVSKKTGIGLKNIDDRIKLMFGEKYGIRISSEPGKGTSVTILLKFHGGEVHV
ncbi:cache domain-containing sensor histidine kinase [Paenibacillus alkalitolerans]|uniref:cache domain-containing sensor histidine kinase n=1 Tax=Paenibacillus alkalitolerans TaxID=2799335 RepID=UPI0018F535CA|nr:sensor histidine kinase [Paenibacillus alkalitolerans]